MTIRLISTGIARKISAAEFLLAAVLSGVSGLITPTCRGCSVFCLTLSNSVVVGKNYDWSVGDGCLFVNKRGFSKVAFAETNPAKWSSRFGSVTFNQFGREMPCGGMNEAGLVVEALWLDETEYPKPDSRPAINLLQWIQYQLDNFDSVEHVIKSDSLVRISHFGLAKTHYFVCDPSGACAVVSFLKGKQVITRIADPHLKVLTTQPYLFSKTNISRYTAFGGKEPLSADTTPLPRFARTAMRLRDARMDASRPVTEEAFQVLDEIRQPGYTKWTLVYNVTYRSIHFYTSANPNKRELDFHALDFSPETPVKMVDINSRPVRHLRETLHDYTRLENATLIKTMFSSIDFLKTTQKAFVNALAEYPDDTNMIIRVK
ncbi:MAG: linear amide C-N hydrolase [Nitrososphaera sp.]|nr:linear amide C-N hydrolase [Nitrososphaera sp.]